MKKISHQESPQYQFENENIHPRQKRNLAGLTAAALVLPGLPPVSTHAAEEDSVDFQYSHYQEGKRDIYGYINHDLNINTPEIIGKLTQNLNPIEVESIHGSARVKLTDRIKFSFNYMQDTWSGASPFAQAGTFIQPFFDNKLNAYRSDYDPASGSKILGSKDNRLTHVLSYASPETRQHGDFKLSYEWNEATLDVGGGVSVENDYESGFANLGGRFDFNQKQTTVNWGVSYTNSDTHADLDPDGLPYFITTEYDNSQLSYNIGRPPNIVAIEPKTPSGSLDSIWKFKNEFNNYVRTGATLNGNREDWGGLLSLTQVINKNVLVSFDLNYTRSTGYLANPYKLVYGYDVYLGNPPNPNFGIDGMNQAWLEIRPDERNLFNWHFGYDQFVEVADAALHIDYSFAHDDWGITAHTFEGEWVQPLGAGWTVTPRIRYYSQSSAEFYTPYIINAHESRYDQNGNFLEEKILSVFPKYYSSDQRLSGFGTLSGGVTIEKQFAKGVSLQTGFEYYTHQGGLKLGGGGEADFADFNYWVANAALKVNLASVSMGGSHAGQGELHHHYSNIPAGVQFDHILPKAGDFMVGYRYMRNVQAGDFRLGDKMISLDQTRQEGCYGRECAVTPDNMTMNMHMLDLMYAPNDWLTLMLMPQWADMDMTMTPNPDITLTGTHGEHSSIHEHQTGGIGDVGAYGLFKLYGDQQQHLNLVLGGTAPTGDVDIVQRKTAVNPVYNNLLHYCMQLGSGTWDFKPALTYTGEADKFSWGAQISGTIRLESKNKSGFAFGDIFQGTTWGGYQWTDWLGTTVRGVFTSQGEIKGRYPGVLYTDPTDVRRLIPYVDQHIDTFGQPQNYGGNFVDLGLGVNVTIPHGAFAGNTLKFEWLQPVHTNFNGFQPDRDYALNFTWSYGF